MAVECFTIHRKASCCTDLPTGQLPCARTDREIKIGRWEPATCQCAVTGQVRTKRNLCGNPTRSPQFGQSRIPIQTIFETPEWIAAQSPERYRIVLLAAED